MSDVHNVVMAIASKTVAKINALAMESSGSKVMSLIRIYCIKQHERSSGDASD